MNTRLLFATMALLFSTTAYGATARDLRTAVKRPVRPELSKTEQALETKPSKKFFQPSETRSTGSVTVGGQAVRYDSVAADGGVRPGASHHRWRPSHFGTLRDGRQRLKLTGASDLVFIDAPGTGFSRIAGKDKEKSFYGVDQDIDTFTKFITQFLTKYGRWSSPKYRNCGNDNRPCQGLGGHRTRRS